MKKPLLSMSDTTPPRSNYIESATPPATVRTYLTPPRFTLEQLASAQNDALFQSVVAEVLRIAQEEVVTEVLQAVARPVRTANPWEWLAPYVPLEKQCIPRMRRCDDTYTIPNASVFPDGWHRKDRN